MSVVVLDTGALIAIERGSSRMLLALRRLDQVGHEIVVPAGCLAQAWRRPSRQVRLAQFLKKWTSSIADLTGADARACGLLLETSGTSDVVDAHVAVLATRRDATVWTSDPDDIRALAPHLRVQQI